MCKATFGYSKCNKDKCTADPHRLHEPLYCQLGHNPQWLCLWEQFTLIYSSFIIPSLLVGCREPQAKQVCWQFILCTGRDPAQGMSDPGSQLKRLSLIPVVKTFLGCTLPHSLQYCLPKLPQHWQGNSSPDTCTHSTAFRTEVWLWYLPCQY